MTINNYTLPATPQNTWELIKTSMTILRHTFLAVFIFSIISTLMYTIILAEQPIFVNKNLINRNIVDLVANLINILMTIAMIFRIDKLANQQHCSLTQTLFISMKRLLPFILVFLIYGCIIIIGLCLLIIPGIMAINYLFFANYLCVTEEHIKIIDCIKLSYRLVRHEGWRTAWVISIMSLIILLLIFFWFYLAEFLIIIIFAFFVEVYPNFFGADIFNAFNATSLRVISLNIAFAVVWPCYYASTLAILYDLKIRNKQKEHLTTQTA